MTAKPRQPHRWSAILAAAVLTACAGGFPSSALAETVNQAQLADLIADLNAPVYATREAATNRLELLEGPIEAMVSNHIKSALPLTQEQITRIETVLETRFRNSPRAALGVEFDRNPQANQWQDEAVVSIKRTIAGFPCSKTLMPGDIIRVVDGIELPPTGGGNIVRTAIFSHLPNEELEIVVERDGNRSFFRVPLGEFARLRGTVPDVALIKSGWELRKARLGLAAVESSKPLTCVVDGERELMPELPNRMEPEVGAGGAPDNGAAMMHLLRSRSSSLTKNHIAATNAKQVRAPRVINKRQVIRNSPEAQRDRLQAQQAQALRQRERYIEMTQLENVSQKQKQAAIANLEAVEATLAAIQAKLTDLNREINEAQDDD